MFISLVYLIYFVKRLELNWIILKDAFMTYGQSCSTFLCNPNLSLTCSTGSGTGCSCPTTYGANICDCNTSSFWNGTSCIATRISFNSPCTQSYQCLLNTGLTCVGGVCSCATADTYWTGTQCRNLNLFYFPIFTFFLFV